MQINLKFKKCSSTDLINLFLLTCHFLKFQAAFVKRQKKSEKRGTECSVTVIRRNIFFEEILALIKKGETGDRVSRPLFVSYWPSGN